MLPSVLLGIAALDKPSDLSESDGGTELTTRKRTRHVLLLMLTLMILRLFPE